MAEMDHTETHGLYLWARSYRAESDRTGPLPDPLRVQYSVVSESAAPSEALWHPYCSQAFLPNQPPALLIPVATLGVRDFTRGESQPGRLLFLGFGDSCPYQSIYGRVL